VSCQHFDDLAVSGLVTNCGLNVFVNVSKGVCDKAIMVLDWLGRLLARAGTPE
jgi:hypothetical protein